MQAHAGVLSGGEEVPRDCDNIIDRQFGDRPFLALLIGNLREENFLGGLLKGRYDLNDVKKPPFDFRRFNRQFAALKYGFVPRKPQFIARTAKFYAESFFFNAVQPLRYVDFAVDYACNLKCAHCFKTSLENKQDHPRLDIDDYKRIA